jgi:hypothetical protein
MRTHVCRIKYEPPGRPRYCHGLFSGMVRPRAAPALRHHQANLALSALRVRGHVLARSELRSDQILFALLRRPVPRTWPVHDSN